VNTSGLIGFDFTVIWVVLSASDFVGNALFE